jgi:hypothetical protein
MPIFLYAHILSHVYILLRQYIYTCLHMFTRIYDIYIYTHIYVLRCAIHIYIHLHTPYRCLYTYVCTYIRPIHICRIRNALYMFIYFCIHIRPIHVYILLHSFAHTYLYNFTPICLYTHFYTHIRPTHLLEHPYTSYTCLYSSMHVHCYKVDELYDSTLIYLYMITYFYAHVFIHTATAIYIYIILGVLLRPYTNTSVHTCTRIYPYMFYILLRSYTSRQV